MKIKDRIKELRRVRAGDISPCPRNWRTHPKAQVAALQGVLTEIGYADALLARELPDGTLELVDGHARQALDPEQIVPVLVLDLDQDEALKLMTVLDPLAGMAEANEAALESLLAEIGTESEALQAMLDGLAKDNGIALDTATPVDAEPQIDRAAELQKEWKTEAGQIWEVVGKAGTHRVMCGDSTKVEDVERLMGGIVAEMMHADPPYGVEYDGGHFHSGSVKIKRAREKLAGDESTDIYGEFLPVAMKVVDGPCYVWFAGSLGRAVYAAVEDSGGVISSLLVWHKTNATYAAMNAQYKQRHEPCLYFKPKGSTLRWVGPADACSLWEFKKEGVNKLHPTQKPTELVANAICNHKAATVYDPFLGSGTTLIAAEQLGRICYGMEISPGYVAVILQRCKDCGMEPRLVDKATVPKKKKTAKK